MGDGGLSKFRRRMQAIPKAARDAVGPALVKQADEIARTMRAIAPEDEGDLKRSIAVTGPGQSTPPYSQPGGSMTVGSLEAAITVGDADTRYPHLVEYGHSNGLHGTTVPPKPFFWPAYRLHKKKAAAAIKRSISKAIRDTK